MGYDVLLEKPISPSEKECRDILQLAKKNRKDCSGLSCVALCTLFYQAERADKQWCYRSNNQYTAPGTDWPYTYEPFLCTGQLA